MPQAPDAKNASPSRGRAMLIIAAGASAGVTMAAYGAGTQARAGLIAGICLLLWLTEWSPVWMPTVLLWCATPLLLGTVSQEFSIREVLSWSIDPVLALFLCGFALAAAAHQHGLDKALAAHATRHSSGSPTRLVVAAAVSTAVLSMWMSNVAAAALMFAAFRPLWESEPDGSPMRRALLLSIALAANVSGIATPIGTGPNGIAMAAVAEVRPVSFLHWMVFGMPLTVALVGVSTWWAVRLLGGTTTFAGGIPATTGQPFASRGLGGVAAIFGITVLLWLSEPLHGVSAWIVALASVVGLLVFRLLHIRNLMRVQWDTLLLVAGGIALGALLDRAQIVRDIASAVPLTDVAPTVRLIVLCLLCAGLSSLMSNTASAALLIPLAASFDAAPSTAIIIAVASSLGMPFVVSTPANAMAVSGGLRSADLLLPGIVLLVGGSVLVAATGPLVLRAVGIQ